MGNLLAEIIRDRRDHPEKIVHLVIQRDDSPEILFLGQFNSRSEAEETARQLMADYLRRTDGDSQSAA